MTESLGSLPRHLWERKRVTRLEPSRLTWVRHGPFGRGLVASAEEPPMDADAPVRQLFGFFPKPEHGGLFHASSFHVEGSGPSALARGSVGVLSLLYDTGARHGHIEYVQGSYRQGIPETLTRDLAFHYKDWRDHLLDEAFVRLKKEGAVSVSITLTGEARKGAGNDSAFRAACRRHGFVLREEPSLEGERTLMARNPHAKPLAE